MADIKRPHGLRLREASAANWKILEGITDSELRRQFLTHLRQHEWVIFNPREIDFSRFSELLEQDPALREWIEQEPDPVLVAEVLSLTYPQLFFTIEQVYSTAVDWKIQRTKKGGLGGGGGVDRPPIPGHLLSALADHELQMVARRQLRKWIKLLNRDPQGTIAELCHAVEIEQDPKQQKVLVYLHGLATELVAMQFPGFVSELVPGKPFPSMHVRLWIRQILERGSALVVGDVGTQKTSAAVVGLEQLGTRAVVVVCRSYARDLVWTSEIARYYENPPEPVVVRGVEDIPTLERMSPDDLRRHRFCVVGYGNIQSGIEDDGGAEHGDRLVAALSRLEPDAIIIDEAHAIKNPGSRSDRVLRLAQLPSVRHRLMLTATPFENNANEVARLATMLDPTSFPTEEIFLALCRDNPRIFFGLMTQRMCDFFAQEEVLDLPSTNVSPYHFFPQIELDCPADIRQVHEAIQNDGALEVRQQVHRMARLLAIPYVARNWYPELGALSCFTDPLANPKLAYLRQEVAERIRNGKVVIASGIFASGITRKLPDTTDDPVLYEIATLFERWFPGQVLRIDAATANGNGSREQAMTEWRSNPNAKILIASVPATAESLNFALARVPGAVERLTVFYLGLPWKPTQYLQFNGRFRRPGTEVPVEVFTLVLRGTADTALVRLNERKWRNFLIGVHGMPILTEEEEALERATFEQLVLTPTRWLQEAFRRMLGLDEERLKQFLAETLKGLPVAQTIAQYYLTTEEFGLSGDVARLVVPTLKRWRQTGLIPNWESVFEGGSATLVYERRLGEPIYSCDINPAAIEAGKAHSYHGGRNAIVCPLSRLPAEWSGKFALTLLPLVLHLTSPRGKKVKEAERAQILREVNRILKSDGLLWCVVPGFCFEETEDFNAFLSSFGRFGFEVVEELTGRVESLDHPEHPRTFWSIVLRKQAEAGKVRLPCPLFSYEQTRVGKPRRKGLAQPPRASRTVLVRHEQFAITNRQGQIHTLEEVLRRMTRSEKETERLFHAMVNEFRIREHLAREELRKVLRQVRPIDWQELKEVWKRVRGIRGMPQVEWAKLHQFTAAFFGKTE